VTRNSDECKRARAGSHYRPAVTYNDRLEHIEARAAEGCAGTRFGCGEAGSSTPIRRRRLARRNMYSSYSLGLPLVQLAYEVRLHDMRTHVRTNSSLAFCNKRVDANELCDNSKHVRVRCMASAFPICLRYSLVSSPDCDKYEVSPNHHGTKHDMRQAVEFLAISARSVHHAHTRLPAPSRRRLSSSF
jgi:hypothetical protein